MASAQIFTIIVFRKVFSVGLDSKQSGFRMKTSKGLREKLHGLSGTCSCTLLRGLLRLPLSRYQLRQLWALHFV